MDITEILARFSDVGPVEDGYLARCPVHGDGRPSLRIFYGEDGKVRLVCRAGCKTVDVIAAVGLTFRNLFNVTGEGILASSIRAVPVSGPRLARLKMYTSWTSLEYAASPAEQYARDRFGILREHAATLNLGYDSGHGFAHTGLAYARHPRLVVPMRDFRGVARGLQGRDVGGRCNVRWMSLRNPEGQVWQAYGAFLQGGSPSGTVLLCEGLSDPLTAFAAGYSAVGVRGASFASQPALMDELAAGLAGCTVVLAGDRDTAGQSFNAALSAALAPRGIDVRWLDLPNCGPKTDIARWREARDTRFPAAFAKAVAAARPTDGTGRPMSKAEYKRLAATVAAMTEERGA